MYCIIINDVIYMCGIIYTCGMYILFLSNYVHWQASETPEVVNIYTTYTHTI